MGLSQALRGLQREDGARGRPNDGRSALQGSVDPRLGDSSDVSGTSPRMPEEGAENRVSHARTVTASAQTKYNTFMKAKGPILKVLLSYYQIVSMLPFVLNLTFPPIFTSLTDIFGSIVNLNFVSLMPLGCIMQSDFHHQMLGYTLGPLIIGGLMILAYKFLKRKPSTVGLSNEIFALFLFMTFLILPTVSIQIFSTFACREFDDGTRYLKVDYSIDCNSSSRAVYFYYAVVMGFVFPIGIPSLYYVQLRNAQKKGHLDPGQKALVNKKAWKRQDNNKKEKVEFQMDEEGAEPPAGEEGWGAWEVIESMTEEEVRVNRGSYPCWTHKTLTLNERRLCSAPSTSGRSSKRSMFR